MYLVKSLKWQVNLLLFMILVTIKIWDKLKHDTSTNIIFVLNILLLYIYVTTNKYQYCWCKICTLKQKQQSVHYWQQNQIWIKKLHKHVFNLCIHHLAYVIFYVYWYYDHDPRHLLKIVIKLSICHIIIIICSIRAVQIHNWNTENMLEELNYHNLEGWTMFFLEYSRQ
jgi:hypothetical protein